ncbi:MAG TPA: acyl-CoA dehydrogenase family protein [Actinomycetota bacterium]|jgi:alkylation response protein AidB-like acyl-CoA dehydrogenase|nr:acyl-CoA dehydrogenase family protein [Actinomycetota bacterium]
MRIAFTHEQEELRRELREYFDRLMTPERREALTRGEGDLGDGKAYRETVRQMGRDGWLGIGWPKEYGGQSRSFLDQLIFLDEAAIAGAPIPTLTLNSVGPTIMQYGTEDQKQRFLAPILAGEIHFAIGYSEPEAGTDLASLRTRAVRSGDEYVVNGQKMWTSLTEYADYVWLAVRTDPDVKKHKGLSVLIVPTDAEGFRYTPVHTVAGARTNATFYEDVRVPVADRVGEENDGWRLITNQLNHERVALFSSARLVSLLRDVREWAQSTKLADGRRVIDQEWVQVHLARVHAKAEVLKLMNWRIAWGVGKGLNPATASATKVFGSELNTEAYRLLMEVLGTNAAVRDGSPGAILHGRIERMYRSSLILTFGGGTNEVQRDIIAMVGLGMPRAPR